MYLVSDQIKSDIFRGNLPDLKTSQTIKHGAVLEDKDDSKYVHNSIFYFYLWKISTQEY